MWSRVWVLSALAASAAVTATNDVFPEEEPDAPPPLPHPGAHRRSHNDVFPLEEESLDVPRLRHASRHHKVVQSVAPQEMENNVCVGTCFSYTVPQTEPETPGDEMLDYCDSCQASESHWTTIQLDCEEYGNTYQVTKKIQMITNCSCSACHPRGQQTTTDNEVTYPSNEPRVSEPFFKMLPESLQRPNLNPELEFTRTSLDELRKALILDPHHEQGPHGKVVFKLPPAFNNNEDEEDPNVVMSY